VSKLAKAEPGKSGKTQLIWNRLAGNPRLETVLFILMLVVFTLCAGYFALHLNKAIIPDEPGHFYLSTLFASTWGTPEMTEYSLALGNIQFNRQPFMYYWINGRLLNLLNLIMPGVSEWRQLLFLRFTSVLYSTLTVLFTYLLSREVIRKRWWPLLVVFLTTGTLMFVFLSGGVSYDNLGNFCAAAGIYYLIRVLQGRKIVTNSLVWIFFIGLGVLVKKTILPLALFMFIFWLVHIIRNRRSIKLRQELNWKFGLITMLTLAIVGVNLSVYGVNLVKYREPIPDCTDLHTRAECDLSVYVKRAKEMGFPEEKLTLRDVIEYKKYNPINYFHGYWLDRMQTTIYGIMGHQAYYPVHLITFYWVFYLFVFIIAIKYWEKRNYIFYVLLGLSAAYVLTILIESYNEELMSNFQHAAVQGRYLFPALASVYVLTVDFISRIAHRIVRLVAVAYSVILFSVGGPVLFLLYFASYNNLDWFH